MGYNRLNIHMARPVLKRFPAILLATVACRGMAAAALPSSTAWVEYPFVQSWLVCGPVPAKAPGGVDRVHDALEKDWLVEHGGETGIRPFQGMTHTGEMLDELKWILHRSDKALNFYQVYGERHECVAYAWADLDVGSDAADWLAIGSDDGVKAWVDGRMVLDHDVWRKFQPDEDLVRVHLARGRHTVLLKVSNGGGEWMASLRWLDGPHALMRAAFAGSTALVASVLDAGVPVNARHADGWTAMHFAADAGRLDVIRLLLDRGADRNAAAVDGATPLEMARRSGRAAVASALAVAGATQAPLPVDLARRADLVVDTQLRMAGHSGISPGVAVGVIRDGKLVYSRACGQACLDPLVPMTIHTKVYLASLSKQFTAMAIMMLAEGGRLSYDDPITRYVPEFRQGGTAITLRHLLHHIAGLPRDLGPSRGLNGATAREAFLFNLGQYQADILVPGVKSGYSNLGYALLGLAVERASGTSYEQFLASRIFKPLGMTETVVHRQGMPPIAGRAVGYRDNGRDYYVVDFENGTFDTGPEGILSTVADLGRWDAALDSQVLVRRATLEEAFAPVRLAKGDDAEYGFGWIVKDVRGLRCVSHDGFHWGVNTAMLHFPNERFAVIVLANLGQFDAYTAAQRIAETYLYDRMKPNPTE